ncbi:hypothetical protein B7463_g12459, partial [Scytalidium lignicola]
MSSSISARSSPERQAELKDETASNLSSAPTPTFDGSQSIDPALLDEDELPKLMLTPDDEWAEKSIQNEQKRGHAINEGGYNALKTFNGQIYSDMAVGGSHRWNYGQGVWKETKEVPDLWKIDYKTTKRRARKAPIGSEYHWLVVAHQYVEKIDANTYGTHLVDSNTTVKAQREREVELHEDAKRRVQGLPPVLKSEKVKVAKQE